MAHELAASSTDGSHPSYDSYDRASVECLLAQGEAERARLLREVATARHQVAAAEADAAASSFEAQAHLASLVLAAHRDLIDARQRNAQAAAQILAEADVEAARILSQAHERVRSIRGGGAAGADPNTERHHLDTL